MNKDPLIFIQHILDSIEKIESYVEGMSKQEFSDSIKTQDAVIRNLEIIGEAAKNVPTSFRSTYPEIPWQKISGLRDVLIHMYFGIDLDIVWEVIQRDLPELRDRLYKSSKK